MPASVSATYSSTVAEELVALLRRLHALEAWNPLINKFISGRLSRIVTMATPTEGETDVVCVTFAWFEITVNKSHMFVRPSVCLFVCSNSFIRVFAHSFVHLFICSSDCFFLCSLVCSFVCSFMHLFVRPFIHPSFRSFTVLHKPTTAPCLTLHCKTKTKTTKTDHSVVGIKLLSEYSVV